MEELKKMESRFHKERQKIYDKGIFHNEFLYAPEKTIANDLNIYSPILLDQVGCKVYELTCDFHPSQVDRNDAWESIKMRENLIVEQLKKNEDVLFILSGVECHTGKKKGKLKVPSEDEETEVSEVVEEDDKKKFLYIVTPEMEEKNPNIYEELLYEIFIKRDENLKVIKTKDRNVNEDVIYDRIYKRSNEILKKKKIVIDKNTFMTNLHIRKDFPSSVYQLFLDNYPLCIFKTPYYKESSLEGYPHIHFAIAVKNGSFQFNNCSDIERYLKNQKFVPFYDIKVTRLSESGTQDTATKKGRKATPYNTETDGPIFSYVLKNDRYYKTLQNLNKKDSNYLTAVTLYNIKENIDVKRFFTFFTQYGISINNVEKRMLNEEELALMNKKPSHKVSYHGELGIEPLKDFIMTSSMSIKSRQIKEMALYMEKNNFAVSFDGIIFAKVKGSINTWRSHTTIKTPEDLFYSAKRTDVNSDLLTESFKNEFSETCKNMNQNDYPKVFVDGFSIEYKDFYYYMPSNAIIKKDGKPNQHYACIQYYPQIKYEDLEKIKSLELIPKNYLYILQNSGYVDEKGIPIGKYGKQLVLQVWQYGSGFRPDKGPVPCLIGQTHSAKSTLFETINHVFPDDNVLLLNDGSDRFIFQSLCQNRNISKIWSDEAKDNKDSISKETMLKIGNFGTNFSGSVRAKEDVQLHNKYALAFGSHTIERMRDPNVIKFLYNPEFKSKYKNYHTASVQLLDAVPATTSCTDIMPHMDYKPPNIKEMYIEDLKALKIFKAKKNGEKIEGIYIYRHQRIICDDDKLTVEERNDELNRDIDQGLDSRFNIYSFTQLKHIDSEGKDKCFKESPLVMLYLGMINNNQTFNEASDITKVNVLVNKSKEGYSKDPSSILSRTIETDTFSHDGEYVRDKIKFYVPKPIMV